jgi:hypothetical protein
MIHDANPLVGPRVPGRRLCRFRDAAEVRRGRVRTLCRNNLVTNNSDKEP